MDQPHAGWSRAARSPLLDGMQGDSVNEGATLTSGASSSVLARARILLSPVRSLLSTSAADASGLDTAGDRAGVVWSERRHEVGDRWLAPVG